MEVENMLQALKSLSCSTCEAVIPPSSLFIRGDTGIPSFFSMSPWRNSSSSSAHTQRLCTASDLERCPTSAHLSATCDAVAHPNFRKLIRNLVFVGALYSWNKNHFISDSLAFNETPGSQQSIKNWVLGFVWGFSIKRGFHASPKRT